MKNIFSVLVILACLLQLMPWTDEGGTRKALNYSGFTEVQTYGHSFFACMSDWSATEFIATNPIGKTRVKGTVCCGLITKACTVRW